jgi:hypothetical protein
MLALKLEKIMNGDDARMTQRRARLRFEFEPVQELGIGTSRQRLEGNKSAKPLVVGLVDLAHAAAAEE